MGLSLTKAAGLSGGLAGGYGSGLLAILCLSNPAAGLVITIAALGAGVGTMGGMVVVKCGIECKETKANVNYLLDKAVDSANGVKKVEESTIKVLDKLGDFFDSLKKEASALRVGILKNLNATLILFSGVALWKMDLKYNLLCYGMNLDAARLAAVILTVTGVYRLVFFPKEFHVQTMAMEQKG